MDKDLAKIMKDIVILEVDRYISCATTNQEREEAYPRSLLELRLVEAIDKVLSEVNK